MEAFERGEYVEVRTDKTVAGQKDMVKLKKLTRVHEQLTRDYEDLQYYSNITYQKLEGAIAQIEVDTIYIAWHKKTLKYCAIVILGLVALNIVQFIY